jgi:hypothetical protein
LKRGAGRFVNGRKVAVDLMPSHPGSLARSRRVCGTAPRLSPAACADMITRLGAEGAELPSGRDSR